MVLLPRRLMLSTGCPNVFFCLLASFTFVQLWRRDACADGLFLLTRWCLTELLPRYVLRSPRIDTAEGPVSLYCPQCDTLMPGDVVYVAGKPLERPGGGHDATGIFLLHGLFLGTVLSHEMGLGGARAVLIGKMKGSDWTFGYGNIEAIPIQCVLGRRLHTSCANT